VSGLVYGNSDIISSKDHTKLSFATKEAYKDFLENKLNRTLLLPTNPQVDCDSDAFCSEIYDGCITTEIEAVKNEQPQIVDIEKDTSVQFDIISFCTLSTSLSYSCCKGITKLDYAGAFLLNYNEARLLLYGNDQNKLIEENQKKQHNKKRKLKDIQKSLIENAQKKTSKNDCNTSYCSDVYVGCFVDSKNAKDAVNATTDKEVIEANMEVSSSCSLLTAFSYSICKDEMTKDLATTLLANYYKTKDRLFEIAKKNKK